MTNIVVASHNPVKIEAARRGFSQLFPEQPIEMTAVDVPSEVSRQPCSDAETLRGALNRAHNAHVSLPQADAWVGIEGGVEEMDGRMAVFAWVVVLSQGRSGQARTGTFFLPPAVADLVRQGVELGEADDIVFGRTNSKQANGAVGLLTGDAIDRTAYYQQAVLLALIPLKNPQLYPPEDNP
jgi:inosine/xanthosine triphosphatase